MEEITEQKGSAGEHTPRPGGIKAHKAAAERHEAEDRDRLHKSSLDERSFFNASTHCLKLLSYLPARFTIRDRKSVV